MYKISLIIPVYNVEKYIKECLDSAVNQTLKDIEIICVDDCGSDNSVEIIKEYQKNDNRIKILHHKKNSGLAASRNTGMAVATGEYLAFLDSDDYLQLNFLEELYKKAKETGADIVQSTLFFYYEDTNLHKDYLLNNDIRHFNPQKDGKLDVYYNAGMCWNKIFRTTLIKEHNITFPEGLYWEDNPFVIEAAYYANNICYTDKTNYIYRQRAGSIVTLGSYKLHFDLLVTHKGMFGFINSVPMSKKEYLSIFKRFMYRIMLEYGKLRHNKELRKYSKDYCREWKKLFKLCKYKNNLNLYFSDAYLRMSVPLLVSKPLYVIILLLSIVKLFVVLIVRILLNCYKLFVYLR